MNIAFIPAKGTSNRVPRKNLQKLGDNSLVRISLEFAESLNYFDYIYLSTDSEEVILSATGSRELTDLFTNSENGVVLPARNNLFLHKRLDGDSDEFARTISPLRNCLEVMNQNFGVVTILQPTSPFREHSEFWEIINLFNSVSAPSMISVKQVEDVHPLKCFQLNENGEILIVNQQLQNLTVPIQDLPRYYVADGAYYITRIEHLLSADQILSHHTKVFVRHGLRTLNVDTVEDLLLARWAHKTHSSTDAIADF